MTTPTIPDPGTGRGTAPGAPRSVPSGLATTWTMASLTLLRLTRGRALGVSLVIAALPVAYAAAMRAVDRRGVSQELFAFEVLVLVVLAPMLVGASIGEEIEDRTTTYLWSRPVPRWTILAGKLAALAPVAMLAIAGSWVAASVAAWGELPGVRTTAALAAGTLVVSLAAMGISALGPRHGTALTISYLLFFDLPLGVLPATIQRISISFQVRALSGGWPGEGSALGAMIALAVIAAIWTTVGALRIRRLEA